MSPQFHVADESNDVQLTEVQNTSESSMNVASSGEYCPIPPEWLREPGVVRVVPVPCADAATQTSTTQQTIPYTFAVSPTDFQDLQKTVSDIDQRLRDVEAVVPIIPTNKE